MEKSKDQAPQNEGPNAESLSRQAREQLDTGRCEEAAALYERALALDAARVNDWINRGLALWSLQRPAGALKCYDRALALAPDNALAWMNRGNALCDLERRGEALESYDRALKIDSSLARAWFNKGDELGRLGRFIEAKACFENAETLGRAQGAEDVALAAQGMVRRCESILINESYS